MFGCLLASFDSTPEADRVLELAAALARRSGLTVHLATVRSPGLEPTADELDGQRRADALREAGIDVEVHLLESNDAGEAIALLASTLPKPLLCVATHGRTAVGEQLLGSFAIHLEHHWPGPVLLLGPHGLAPEGSLDRLLVCVEDPDAVPPLSHLAQTWTRTFGGRSEVFEALDPGTVDTSAEITEPITPELQAATEALPGATLTTVADRDPARAIVEAGDAPGTVVALYSHLRRGLARIVVGSVAGEVLRDATCPVLLLPRRD